MFTMGLGPGGNPSKRKRLREKWDPSDVEEDRRRNSQNEGAVNTVPGKGVSECVRGSPGTSLTRAEKVWLKGGPVTSFRVSKDTQDLKQFSKPEINTKWGFKGKVLLWLAGCSGELSLQAVCLHIQNRRSSYINREKTCCSSESTFQLCTWWWFQACTLAWISLWGCWLNSLA